MYASWAGLPAKEITPKTLRYTAAANLLEGGCSLEELKEFMGHTDIDVTRAFVNGIEKCKQQGWGSRSYLSKRRSVGAQPGNRNAGGLEQYLAAAKADGVFEELVDVLKAEPGFDGEILLLRLALRAVLDDMLDCDDLDEGIKRLKVVGSAAERIGVLVYKRWKMKQVTQAEEMQAALRQAIDELMQERRQTGTAAARE
jgi:hypothetical protein